MSVQADILAIVSRSDISAIEKARLVGSARAKASYDAIVGTMLPCPVDGDQVTVVLDSIEVQGNAVSCMISAFRADGQEIEIDRHFVFVNPPMLIPDMEGEVIRISSAEDGAEIRETFREDPAAALEQCILDALRPGLAGRL